MLAAVGEELVDAAGRAERFSVDLAGRDTGLENLRPVGLPQVQSVLSGDVRVEILVAIWPRVKTLKNLAADLITTDADGGTDSAVKTAGIGTKLPAHPRNPLLENSPSGSLPAGMKNPYGAVVGIDQHDGHTIGGLNSEPYSGAIGKHPVAGGLFCLKVLDAPDLRRVDLVEFLQWPPGGSCGCQASSDIAVTGAECVAKKIEAIQRRESQKQQTVALVLDKHLDYDSRVILSVGVDMAEVERVRRAIETHGGRFVDRIYTAEEKRYCGGKKIPWTSWAARFAAKEAAMKALGTGWRGVSWKDVGVVRKPGAAPEVEFSGQALSHFERLGATRAHLSLSHTADLAIAVVILEK